MIRLLKWAWSYFSYHFCGVDYPRYRCAKPKQVDRYRNVYCTRMEHHLGKCNHKE